MDDRVGRTHRPARASEAFEVAVRQKPAVQAGLRQGRAAACSLRAR
jgi:hypothetical protein